MSISTAGLTPEQREINQLKFALERERAHAMTDRSRLYHLVKYIIDNYEDVVRSTDDH